MRSTINHACIVISLMVLVAVDGARILGVFHVPSHSHHKLGDRIFKELAARGHEVTVITPFEEKRPIKNFKQVVLTGVADEMEDKDLFSLADYTVPSKIVWIDMLGLEFTEKTLNHSSVQKLLNSDEHFDLVIVQQFINEAMKGFCHHFKAHCVVVSTLGGSRWTNPQMGNPGPPSYVPDVYLSFASDMNFFQRFFNTVVYIGAGLLDHFYTFPQQNELLQKYFPGAPHLSDLHYNTSLMLLNSHVSTNPAVPHVPNMIEIGGYHISPPKKLPADLQQYLDGAKEGVIYFSMGSNLKSKAMGDDKRDAILKAFSKLKQKVLWKWEDDELPGQPRNVKLVKWLPQQDILAHPNVKLFITHGGLLSTIETVYFGVPIVGIPVFADQLLNVANAVSDGYGISVPYKTLTEEALGSALNEVLNNSKYGENAKRRSKIMHDQPMKPLDKATFWIEYVLRHNGAHHLRSAALKLTWYQYSLLDVSILLSIIVFIILVILGKLTKRYLIEDDEKVYPKEKNN